MKHLFIVNPAAGGRDRSGAVLAKASELLSGTGADWEVYTTTGPMDACRKIEAEAASGTQLRVYACGGDGTLNECVCGAAERPNVAVTHFPSGTGNDFIKVFEEDKDKFFSLENLIGGEVRPLDVIKVNDRYSMNICSVGIDARIGVDVHKYSHIPIIGGATGYVTSTAVNLFKGITDELRVVCDGKLYYGEMNIICACNGSYYGGGFHPVPEARPDDGLLDFLIIKGVSRLTFARLVLAYSKGKYASFPQYITHVRTRSLEIQSEREIVVNVDGEAMWAKNVSMSVLPGGVNFIVPRGVTRFAPGLETAEAL